MKAAIEQVYNGTIATTPVTAYDKTKINLGTFTGQFNVGGGDGLFVGPNPPAPAFFGESGLAIPSQFVHPIRVAPDLWWIFASDLATAAATRRVQLWTFIPSTNTTTLIGAVTLTFPTATVHTVRGLRAILTNISTGTVAVSGTAVTGTGTAFTTGISVGSRIGFGSTDPNAITTWYPISAIASATGATLGISAGTVAAGTAYVIQDLMVINVTTNATATNGGLFVAKGLRFEDFQQPALTIPAATTVDKIKAVYWLRDAATLTNTAAGGSAIDDLVSLTSQFVYVVDGAASSLKVYKYNFRAPLTLTAGGATLAAGTDVVVTGAQTVTGTIIQQNNGRLGTLNHGPGAGVLCLYALTSTRVLRIPVAGVTTGSTTFVIDSMSEVVPGGANTNVAAGTFLSFDIAGSIDRLVIVPAVSTGTMYVTQYNTSGVQYERRFNSLINSLNAAARDVDKPAYPHFTQANSFFIWVEEGWMFCVVPTVTANLNVAFVYPFAADYLYSSTVTGGRIITPAISLGGQASKLYRVVVNSVSSVGDETMGAPTDAFRVRYRTSGIDDNSGTWLAVGSNGDLSGLSTPSEIQFAFEFRTLGTVLMPARILNLALLYETVDDLPSQYMWNFADFSTATATFAWIQTDLFSSLTTHTIEIYRADTNALVLSQASTSTTNGTFQFHNGSTWVAGLGTNTLGVRRRFVPSGSLPGGIDLYAKLSVA
jgi:hypothetical protein